MKTVSKYISMLIGMKASGFKIWLDGILCDNKWSFGVRKPSIIKAILTDVKESYEMLNLVGYELLNIQSLMFK
jgi:hypothetical protein